MRARLARALGFAAALGAGALVAAPAAMGQPFQLGAWSGSVGTGVDFLRDDSRLGATGGRVQSTILEERLTLRNAGAFVYDPRLVSLTLEGNFGYAQNWWRNGEAGFRNEPVWGYDASATVLQEKAYPLRLFARRDEYVLGLATTGAATSTFESRGAKVQAYHLCLPSTLSFRQEDWAQYGLRSGGGPLRGERRSYVTYEGQRGWLNQEMDLRYEFVDSSDQVYRNLGYRRHEGSLYYSLDFGPALEWRWDSRLRGYRQRGVADVTFATLDELVRGELSDTLRATGRYLLTYVEAIGGATTTHTGQASLEHRLYRSLVTTATLETVLQDVTGGHRDIVGGRLDVAYTKRLTGDGRLDVGLGGSLHYEDDRLAGGETFVPQETITFATPIALAAGLKNPLVVEGSVSITKVAAGPLPPGCTAPSTPPVPLLAGQDYTLRAAGDVTEIVPVPCSGSTPGINPGDTIAVDYRHVSSPSLAFTTTRLRADVAVNYRWIRPYLLHDEVRQHAVSGHDGAFLDHRQTDAAGVELRYDRNRLVASLLAEARRFTSQRQSSYDGLRLAQGASVPLRNDLVVSLAAEESLLDYLTPSRRVRTAAVRLGLLYALESALSADFTGGVRWYDDPLSPTERIVDAMLRIRWVFRALELTPTLAFVDRRRGESDLTEYRAVIRLLRRF